MNYKNKVLMTNLNMIFDLVVTVYGFVKISKPFQFADAVWNSQYHVIKQMLRRLERVFYHTRACNVHQDARITWMNQNKVTGS